MVELSQRNLAEALQRVLLPPGLPELPGWAAATLYEPAGRDMLIGGDFYDWFRLPNGHLLFFLGDVSGKGPVAGALGMSIRKALKGACWAGVDPFSALPVLEAALEEELRGSFASLVMLELTGDSGRVRLMLAGHPAPWVRHRGVFREAQAPVSALLGFGLAEPGATVELQLEAGDLLLLFSDGLSEARLPNGELFSEGHLQEFLATLPAGLSSYQLVLQADAHLRRLAHRLTDDVVIAVLGYQPQESVTAPPPVTRATQLVLRLAPHSSSVPAARAFATGTCRSWGLAEAAETVAIVVSELVTNAVLHARTDIELRLEQLDDTVRVEIHDDGPGLPRRGDDAFPAEHPLPRDHGYGLMLVEMLTRAWGVTPAETGKTVWATIDTPAPLRSPAR